MILEDGIKKELINLISKMLDSFLIFKQNTIEDFEARLEKLSENFSGYKNYFFFLNILLK